MPASPLDLYGHLYPGEMDRYADRLNEAAGMSDAAKMRPAPPSNQARSIDSLLSRRWRRIRSNPRSGPGLEYAAIRYS
jgi:hypothetical protein